KHPAMKPLAQRAGEVASGLAEVSYTWIPRAQNAHADALANEAMDAAAQGRPVRLGAAGGSAEGAAAGPSGAAEAAGPAPAAGWSDPATDPTRLLLLRHGQTPLSVERRFAGVGDVELTDAGRAQARAAAGRLAGAGIEAVVASPLRRTMDTAEIAAAGLGLQVEPEPGLRETDFGAWEGMTFAEVRRDRPAELAAWLADPEVAPPGGESLAEAGRRVGKARDALVERYRGRTVLVVSHVTPIKAIVAQALGAPVEALYRMHLDVAGLSEVACYSDGPMVLRSFNDTAHLAGEGPA